MSVLVMQPGTSDDTVRVGAIELDRTGLKVRRRGRELRLGPVEFRLLELLVSEPGRIFTRAEILERTWPSGSGVDMRTIDAHVRHLRRILGRDAIRTVRGQGYGFREDAAR